MLDDAVKKVLRDHKVESIILVGTEAHACDLQTALDLLREGISVFVLADAVSSCNRAEIPIALGVLRQAGAVVMTTESIMFRMISECGISIILGRRSSCWKLGGCKVEGGTSGRENLTFDGQILTDFPDDAKDARFAEFADLVKENKERSKETLKTLLGGYEPHG